MIKYQNKTKTREWLYVSKWNYHLWWMWQ